MFLNLEGMDELSKPSEPLDYKFVNSIFLKHQSSHDWDIWRKNEIRD